MTTLMAFQEVGLESVKNPMIVEHEKSYTRQVQFEYPTEDITINKIEPPMLPFVTSNSDQDETEEDKFQLRYFAWLLLRHSSKGQRQIQPAFSGFLLRLRQGSQIARPIKYEETFLLPITTKVTDGRTIISYMKFLLKQAKKMNLQYCNITLDVGAAMNAYLVEWMKQEEFKNIIIHLGDFHFIKENFKVLGLLIKNSGFLDIVFCSGICSSGRLKEWSNCR